MNIISSITKNELGACSLDHDAEKRDWFFERIGFDLI